MKCLVVQPIHQRGLDLLAGAGIECVRPPSPSMNDVASVIPDCDAVITRNAGLDRQAIEAGIKLRIIGSHGSGTNMLDLPAAAAAGIPVVTTPGANARSVAELALSMAFSLVKRTIPLDKAVREGNWDARYQVKLRELSGMTLGIVGFGQIGRVLARMAVHGFGMKVDVYSPSVPAEDIIQAECRAVGSLMELAQRADIVSLHRPANPGAHALIDDSVLSAMKKGAILINTARAELVDEAALMRHLSSGHLAGAGIDVFAKEPPPADHPLFGLPQVVLAPHAGGSTEEALARTAEAVASQVAEALSGKKPAHLVDTGVWERRRFQLEAL